MRLSIYCDGGCRGNQNDENIGGWGAYLVWGAYEKRIYGGAVNTTNNIMELTAAIEGLRAVVDRTVPCDVYLDSAYVYGGMTEWIRKWKANNWRTAKKDPVANRELWIELDALRSEFSDISFHKVKGHSDNVGNNIADELANRGMDELEHS